MTHNQQNMRAAEYKYSFTVTAQLS